MSTSYLTLVVDVVQYLPQCDEDMGNETKDNKIQTIEIFAMQISNVVQIQVSNIIYKTLTFRTKPKPKLKLKLKPS